jgi:hypothetical protein
VDQRAHEYYPPVENHQIDKTEKQKYDFNEIAAKVAKLSNLCRKELSHQDP